MLKMVPVKSIKISPNRQRRDFAADTIDELADSIHKNGLLHPIVVRVDSDYEGFVLVAGERRLRAIATLGGMMLRYHCGGIKDISPEFIPCLSLGDLTPTDAFEAELEENLRRVDLSWQESCQATEQLLKLRQLQAGPEVVTPADIAQEVHPDYHPNAASEAVRTDLILARHLDDPDVASAPSRKEGMKIIERKEAAARSVQLSERVGRSFTAADHTLVKGDCLEWMAGQAGSQFDVILTDPPYGIDAQEFNDSGGKAVGGGHDYDDSYNNWETLIEGLAHFSFRVAKPQAHAYVFCDIDNFIALRAIFAREGWECFRTPLVWVNPTSQRAPWPQHGPHRKYQLCLYAIKGKRPALKLAPDVITHASDPNLGWHAQKPVGLYQDLLGRSCRAGDSVLDAFCGTGTIFPAAHSMKVKATGIEMDATAHGIAAARLGRLK